MKTNDYFEKTGTENEIENSMVENIACNKANAALLVSIIHNNEGLLSIPSHRTQISGTGKAVRD